MNWKAMAAATMLTVVMIVSTIPIMDSEAVDESDDFNYEGTGDTKTYYVPNGVNLKDYISKVMSDDTNITMDKGAVTNVILKNLTLELEVGGNYTYSKNLSFSVTGETPSTFIGTVMTINGNGASITFEEGSGINYTTNSKFIQQDATLNIKDANFVSNGPTNYQTNIHYWSEVNISDCTFHNNVITVSSTLNSRSLNMESCDFFGNEVKGADKEYFAVTLTNILAVDVKNCSFDGYFNGINFKPNSNSDLHGDAVLSVSGSSFTNLLKTGVQQGEINPDSKLDMYIENNVFEDCGIALKVHEVAKATGNIESSNNEYKDCEADFAMEANPSITIKSYQDRFEKNGGLVSTPSIIDEDGNRITSDLVEVTDPIKEQSPSTPGDDEDLPPFIPTQPADDDDTVTIVACAAAAAVAAILAVFLVIDRKG